MVSIKNLCKRRSIAKYSVDTPLLVPSFSSKGFSSSHPIWDSVQPFLPEAALISSYDIYYGHFSSLAESPNLLFIDSGGYEARKDFDLSELYATEYHPQPWTQQKYGETLDHLHTLANLVLVSYDELLTDRPLAKQAKEARNFFSKYPEAATDFLAKPSSTVSLDCGELAANVKLLKDFDILGVTEKELGETIQERLGNVIKLRMALLQHELEIPIHIFGCLDPISIWLFYICGADIFDGLTWLRLAFWKDIAIYRNGWAILQGNIDIGGRDLEILSWLENLRYLSKQKLKMVRFAQGHDVSEIPIESDILSRIANSIGLELRKGA